MTEGELKGRRRGASSGCWWLLSVLVASVCPDSAPPPFPSLRSSQKEFVGTGRGLENALRGESVFCPERAVFVHVFGAGWGLSFPLFPWGSEQGLAPMLAAPRAMDGGMQMGNYDPVWYMLQWRGGRELDDGREGGPGRLPGGDGTLT